MSKPLTFQLENRSKLGEIAHFSTMPYDTCYQNCKYCYSIKSARMYPSVKSNYTTNTDSLNNGVRLPNVQKNRNIVRMYVSGDFQNVWTVSEWIRLARENKHVTFYGYTKQWKSTIDGMLPMLNILHMLPNVVLRASIDKEIGYDIPQGWTKAGILEDNKKEGKYFVCKSNKSNQLKCLTCKVCYLPKHQNTPVYFPPH